LPEAMRKLYRQHNCGPLLVSNATPFIKMILLPTKYLRTFKPVGKITKIYLLLKKEHLLLPSFPRHKIRYNKGRRDNQLIEIALMMQKK